MSNTAANVLVGGNGIISHAPTGTTLPTWAFATLAAAFDDVGYISEEGVTQTIGRETNKIKAWQNGDTVRELQTAHDLSISFKMIEHNDESVSIYYGTGNTAASIQITGETLGRESFVIDVLDGDGILRIVIPDGEVTATEDVAYRNEEVIAYGVTITCYPDTNGVKAYLYMDADGIS